MQRIPDHQVLYRLTIKSLGGSMLLKQIRAEIWTYTFGTSGGSICLMKGESTVMCMRPRDAGLSLFCKNSYIEENISFMQKSSLLNLRKGRNSLFDYWWSNSSDVDQLKIKSAYNVLYMFLIKWYSSQIGRGDAQIAWFQPWIGHWIRYWPREYVSMNKAKAIQSSRWNTRC